MSKPSIYGLTMEQLVAWLMERGHKPFRASQVWYWLYFKRVTSFAEMHDVNPTCVELLEEYFSTQTLTEYTRQESIDGTIKFLFKLHDGHLIETVLMRQRFGLSVCVTTQVGCNIGCSFCASGLLPKQRNLTSGEIVEQLMMVQRYLDQAEEGELVSHMVVMGIGEPFDNYDNLMDFLHIITDRKGLAIAAKRITVSTSGLVDEIRQFADEPLQVNLAISLHAPTNELRTRIMRINRAYPLEVVMQAVDYYLSRHKRKITIEYILLRGINDSREQALELAELIGDRRPFIMVNLIPYNPVDEHTQYQRSEHDTVLAFYDTLKKQKISCSTRLEIGTDID
ncbi:MAG: 23S rRNA (adenine(2503)-C(2))-methyltransferase RlmN, partial [Gorillibacterium sp.]|nr:23S rRNA (adenine(2503)-C(2))-methyltransferase RlmN [Gorillibacterium sp.]